MSNIDKQSLRDIAAAAVSATLWHAVGVFGEVVDPANPEWKPVHDFCKTFAAERVLALLDELEAAEKRIGELDAREVKLPERYEVEMCPTPLPDGDWYSREDVLTALATAGLKVAAAGKGE